MEVQRPMRIANRETDDILEILPPDPFGMGISNSTFTAWLEHFYVDYGNFNRGVGNYQLFAGFNSFVLNWNHAMEVSSIFREMGFNQNTNRSFWENNAMWFQALCNDSLSFGNQIGYGFVDDVLSFQNNEMDIDSEQSEEAGPPHPAIGFALGYLCVQDLLVVERVCRSLHSTVQSDPLLWRSIRIEPPLNEKITDDVLFLLTNRAQGNLQSLCLEDCAKISDGGLRRVLDNNPRLVKLSIPGYTKLSIEGIVNNLEAFKSMGSPGVKHLRIGGHFGVTRKHFEKLKLLLDIDSHMPRHTHKPHYFTRTNPHLSLDDDRIMDIELCPRCQNPKLVYDCPSEHCQGKDTQVCCRACTICVARCFDCGRCITNNAYVETFNFDCVCLDCCIDHLKCHSNRLDIIHHG